jgi:hypothetical protein
MQRQIKFFPSSGGLRNVPAKTTEQYEITESGEKRRLPDIVKEWRTEPDLSDRQLLKLYEDDRDVAMDALAWRCSQKGEINFTLDSATRDPDNPELISFLLPGSFSEELTPEDVHQAVEDFVLLRDYFPSFEDVFLLQTGSNRFQAAIIEHLVEAQEQITDLLCEVGFSKKVPVLPKWIKRVLQLRKEK